MSETTNPAPMPVPSKRSKSLTPANDINLKDLANVVSASWKNNPQITLVWTTQTEFDNAVAQFNESLGQRLTTGGSRASVTNELKNLDKKIGEHTEYLKVYLKEKYGKANFTAYFPQFGIEIIKSRFLFPTDRNKRSEALTLTLQALQAHGFADKTYGLAFWQEIKDQYDSLLNTAVATDGNVAGLVQAKNQHRDQILKTLNALIHIIKGNYPDEYASVLRSWGFQKEKY